MTQTETFVLNADTLPAEKDFNRYVEQAYLPRVTALSKALTDGRINVDDWLLAFNQELNFLIFTAVQLGKGGADKLTDADLQFIRDNAAQQRQYAAQWAEQLRQKADPKGFLLIVAAAAAVESTTGGVSMLALIARAALYAKTARSLLSVAITLGMGMPLLPAYPRDNSSQCFMNDACHWVIVPTGPNSWDCYWRLTPGVESCDNCLRRAEIWNPLVIADGVIQPYDARGLFR